MTNTKEKRKRKKYVIPLLTKGGQSPDRFTILLECSGLRSPEIIKALWDHFVLGHDEAVATMLIDQPNYCRAVRKLNVWADRIERIKAVDFASYKGAKI